jgi:hypothetical protein
VQSRGQLWLILWLPFLVGMDVRLGLKVYLNVGAEVVVLCRFCMGWEFGGSVSRNEGNCAKRRSGDHRHWQGSVDTFCVSGLEKVCTFRCRCV